MFKLIKQRGSEQKNMSFFGGFVLPQLSYIIRAIMSDKKPEVTLEDIVSLCKRRGFIFQGSEIYGGLAGTWDYGPLGVQLKKNLMDLWWKLCCSINF
jgi:hypothetical protein